MKLRHFAVANILSFGSKQATELNPDFTILIGPNGGGKSNLLDVIQVCLRRYFFRPWMFEYDNTGAHFQNEETFGDVSSVLGRFDQALGPTVIEVEIEITAADVEAIDLIAANADEVAENGKKIRNSAGAGFFSNLKPGFVKVGDRLKYEINEGNTSYPDGAHANAAQVFQNYLTHFQQAYHLLGEKGRQLTPPFVTFPPYRGAVGHVSSTTLANQSRRDLELPYLRATSRQPNSLLALATYHFASIRRQLEADGKGLKAFYDDETVKSVTKALARIGYGWELKLNNPQNNTYEIVLSFGDKVIPVSRASSGEREIINFIFGIYALNAKNGLITIDEPELHLHPKWQRLLFEVLTEIQKPTNNQLVLATHSPSFISADSFGKIKRIAKVGGESKIVSLEAVALNNRKDLLHLINSHNNEKLFFADKVILVEGIQDRLLIERLLKVVGTQKAQVIEVLEVHGKTNFIKYQQLLDSLQVTHFVIADRDYAEQLATGETKKLFEDDIAAVGNALGSTKSTDRQAMAKAMDRAVKDGNWNDVGELWKYIVARHRSLKADLTDAEKQLFAGFVASQETKHIYLLPAGTIEEYLPAGKTSLDATVALVAASDFVAQMKGTGRRYAEIMRFLHDIVAA